MALRAMLLCQTLWKLGKLVYTLKSDKSNTPEAEFPGISKSRSDDDFAPVLVREYFYRHLQCMKGVQAGVKPEKYDMYPDDC